MSDTVENLDTRELGFSDAEDEPEEVDFSEFNPLGKCRFTNFTSKAFIKRIVHVNGLNAH